ncbi:MAG: LPXTG cell wall anchor domain-containing protein [Candidatus Microthrix sp.]|nr:LPXTG cell wall anchor domain-containing protein [Candidatus Microthrix sp.]MBK6437110.1 LPXTG cell wall anchor domain-containing protein [Candidatus Microthrix sp.]
MSSSIARLVAVAALALGGLVVAGTAGAQGYDSGGADAGADGGPGADTVRVSKPDGQQPIPRQTADAARVNPRDSGSPAGGPGVPIAAPGTTGGGTTGVAPAAYPVVSGTAQAPYAGQLGNTGTSASTIAIVAAAVVLVGSALVLGARRRKQV